MDATSGVLDTTFTGSTGANNSVNALTLSGSNLYVGGEFTTYKVDKAMYYTIVEALNGNLMD